MDPSDRDKRMYRMSTHRAVMDAIKDLALVAIEGYEHIIANHREHVSNVVRLALQQSYQEGMRRGAEMSMAAGRKALREFINEHQPMDGEHMSDITFWTRASYKEE